MALLRGRRGGGVPSRAAVPGQGGRGRGQGATAALCLIFSTDTSTPSATSSFRVAAPGLGTIPPSHLSTTLPMLPLSTLSLVSYASRGLRATSLPPPTGRPVARCALRARVPGHAPGGAAAAVRAAASGPSALCLRAAASAGALHSPAQEPRRKGRAGRAGRGGAACP